MGTGNKAALRFGQIKRENSEKHGPLGVGVVGSKFLAFTQARDLALPELKDVIRGSVLFCVGEQEDTLGQGSMNVVWSFFRGGTVVGQDHPERLAGKADGNAMIAVDPRQTCRSEWNQRNGCSQIRPYAPERQSLADGCG